MGVRDTNPMVATSAFASSISIFSSTPIVVEEMTWTSISTSSSLTLIDMAGNEIFHAIGEPGNMRIFEDPRVLANGLRFSTSTNMEQGKLFVWVR